MEELASGFESPPAEAKPFVRWWWNDNRVEKRQIVKQLDSLKASGFGGVEINPISVPGSQQKFKTEVEALQWRSRKWDQMVLFAAQEAAKRGMLVDLLPGSGWPFGGEFLTPEQQIMRVSNVDRAVTGPKKVEFSLKAIDEEMRGNINHGDRGEVELRSVKIYPKGVSGLDQVQDITAEVGKGEVLTVNVPEGDHVVSFQLFQRSYRHVSGGITGAKGPSMDHYDARVTRLYLDRLRGVEETWGEPLRNHIRAIFCDSIETAASNWTHDMLESFEEGFGYDIEPYLTFALWEDQEVRDNVSSDFNDLIRRARYDWSSFLGMRFHTNFTKEFVNFCADNGLLSRFQAYGTPYLMAMAEGYTLPDIPESNNWIREDPDQDESFTPGYTKGQEVWSKYASAGGRLQNRRIVSIEAMTITDRLFDRTLSNIKQADDVNFILGINHTVLHGYNSNPLDVPFPGYIRFGAYFSEFNTWWPYLEDWAEYNARVSWVMQNTGSTSEVAILAPTPDVWSNHLLVRGDFHKTPRYVHELWEPIAQLGGGSDYLHAAAVEAAEIGEGRLRRGGIDVGVLLVVENDSMRPETAEALQEFVASGGKLAFVGTPPSRSPGLRDRSERDQRVVAAVEAMRSAGALMVDPPSRDGLRTWVDETMGKLDASFGLEVQEPREGLYTLRKKAGDEDVFFITNTHQRTSTRTKLSFDLGDRGLWRWDPQTGERTPYDLPYDSDSFCIDLDPVESILLLTGPKEAPKQPRQMSKDGGPSIAVEGPWTVRLAPAQEDDEFEIEMSELTDLSTSGNKRVASFSGVAHYSTTFDLEDTSFTKLNLGWDHAQITEVFVNGENAGTNWYGTRSFDVGPYLRKGKNELVVKYTTTLNNKMNEPKPVGLMGPVELHKP